MKKWLIRSSILIPILLVYKMLCAPVAITILEVKLYWSREITLFLFLVFTIVWYGCSPFRKYCCNGRWTEIFFHLVPVEALLLLIFAEWHFVSAILLVVLLFVLEIVLFAYIQVEEDRYPHSKKRHRRYQGIFARCSVLVMSLVTAIPCFLSVFAYQLSSPAYKAKQEVPVAAEGGTEPAEDEDIYEQNQALFDCFQQGVWDKYDVHERITVMQQLVNFESGRLGIPAIPVSAEKLDGFTLGLYDIEEKEMKIDVEYLMECPVENCVSTICHETYHSAQQYLMENIDWENEVFQSAYFEELRSWKDNEENYTVASFEEYEAYAGQPLEASARQYAEEESKIILSHVPCS